MIKTFIIKGISFQAEDIILPNGKYFSELTEEEQISLMNWVRNIAKRLSDWWHTYGK